MNNLLILLFLSFTLNSYAGAGAKKNSFDSVKIKTQKVAGGVYILKGAGGNIAISAGKDGILMVDSQFSPLNKKIKKAITKIQKGKVDFLINTHWHGDHTGGNSHFSKNAHILAQENVRTRLARDQIHGLTGKVVKAIHKKGLPNITFKNSIKIYFNDEEIEIIHFRKGHTDGDSIVLFKKSKVAHLGDHFFNFSFPFIDSKNGGNIFQYHANVKEMLKLIPANYKIIPGHGTLANIADLKNYETMLENTIDHVRTEKNNGKTLIDIQKRGVGKKYKPLGQGFIKEEKWIEFIYNAL